MTRISQPRPVVRAAVRALDAFGAHSAREATILLGYWCRRDELTPADIDEVLSYYQDPENTRPVPAPRTGPDGPTGLTKGRGASGLNQLVSPYADGRVVIGRHCSGAAQR
jgi:hypothetical protein